MRNNESNHKKYVKNYVNYVKKNQTILFKKMVIFLLS